ncbi:hypothetical protein TNCV_4451971 [Trichonephila clavipes]|nr:hypothetical protein TNCV_4451971 [Trichonephila clavipes]
MKVRAVVRYEWTHGTSISAICERLQTMYGEQFEVVFIRRTEPATYGFVAGSVLRIQATSLVTLAELRKTQAKPSDLSWHHLPAKRATQSRQIHLTQKPKASDIFDAANKVFRLT